MAVQVWSCRECQSFSWMPEGTGDNTWSHCDQVDDLLSLVAELNEEVVKEYEEAWGVVHCKKFVLVEYLQEQVVKLQDTVFWGIREAETELDSGLQFQWWGITACWGEVKNSPPSTHGKEGGSALTQGLGNSEKTKQNTKPKNNKRGNGQIKGLPSKPDIPPQKCFVAAQVNETVHPE